MTTQANDQNPNAPEPQPSPEDLLQFHLGYSRVEAKIRAVPIDKMEAITLEIPSTCSTVMGAFPEIQAHRPELEQLYTFDISQVDSLQDLALALAHLHSEYRASGGASDNVAELAAQCLEIRDRMHDDATALAGRKLLDKGRVDKLHGGNGYRFIAFDITGLVGLFLEQWDNIEGKTAVEKPELDEARKKAAQLVAALGLREQSAPVPNETAQLRQQAYTLLVRSYTDTRDALAFVRRAQGDVDRIAPSLFAGRGRRATTPEEVVTPAAVPAAQPGVEPSVTLPITPAVTVPVGFPGSSPLRAK